MLKTDPKAEATKTRRLNLYPNTVLLVVYFLNILLTRIRTHSWDSLKSSTQCWTSFENSSSEIRPPTRSLFKISFFVTDKSLSSEPRSLVNPGSIMFHTASAWWTWIKSLITSLDIFKTPNQFLHHFICMQCMQSVPSFSFAVAMTNLCMQI